MIDMKRVLNLNDWGREDYIRDHMLASGYKFLGAGRHRMTFLAPHNRFVLKFPKNQSGFEVNHREAELWSKHHWNRGLYDVYYAPCRLVRDSILMMRTVVDLHGETTACAVGQSVLYPLKVACRDKHGEADSYSVNFTVDSCQIGRLPNGKWVAYDYGSE